MSRIGNMPIPMPQGVEIKQDGDVLTVKGPKGTLSRELPRDIQIVVEDGQIVCKRPTDSKEHRALHGLTRSLVNNMVVGVTNGFQRRLEVQGVGYRAELQGKNLVLQVGYSQPVTIEPMDGVEFEVGLDTAGGYILSGGVQRMPFVLVKGIDKETVGQQSANIRRIKPPDPYKAKGIRYHEEKVRRKAGKAGKAAGK